MSDISKCKNELCTLKETCWRFNAPSSPYRQSYGSFEQDENDKCEYYWEFKFKENDSDRI